VLFAGGCAVLRAGDSYPRQRPGIRNQFGSTVRGADREPWQNLSATGPVCMFGKHFFIVEGELTTRPKVFGGEGTSDGFFLTPRFDPIKSAAPGLTSTGRRHGGPNTGTPFRIRPNRFPIRGPSGRSTGPVETTGHAFRGETLRDPDPSPPLLPSSCCLCKWMRRHHPDRQGSQPGRENRSRRTEPNTFGSRIRPPA